MRIIEISVTDLFGVFNHTVPLNIDERVTIIHGPNGFGKTILLKMLDGLFNGRYSELRSIPYQRFQIRFDDGRVVWADKARSEPTPTQPTLLEVEGAIDRRRSRRRERPPTVRINLLRPKVIEPESFALDTIPDDIDIPLTAIDALIPQLDRVGPRDWIDHSAGETLSLEEVLSRFGDLLPFELSRQPDWWTEVQELIDIRLIEAQRLLSIRAADRRRRRLQMIPVVEEFSEELAETIQRKLAESAALSQSLDRTFPIRLVEQMGRSELTEDELRRGLGELEKQRSRLEEVGLLDREEGIAFLPPSELSSSTKDVLEVYVQDVEEKLSTFDEIADKIELFKQIINARFLYKQIAISKQDGFSFTTSDGKPLPVAALSSGEQHELVLLYQLLFKASPNSLILIDEPELSLHVAWQKQFLRDLQGIAKLASLDVLIATHSPQIIHDRWDLTVELKGPAIS